MDKLSQDMQVAWQWLVGIGKQYGLAGWAIQVFVIVFLVLLADWILRRLLIRIQRRTKQTRSHWDDALLEAIDRPLTTLIWVVGISFAAEVIYSETKAAIFAAIPPLRDVGVIASLTWFLWRLIRNVERAYIEGKVGKGREGEVDRVTVEALGKLLRISLVVTSTLVALQTLGFSVSGVLAFGGIGGIAIGFAAKDLLSNVFGGLMLYLDRPFVAGDWIRSADREIEGTVEEIGWRLTRIRKFDKRPIYVPNAIFATIAVENPSRMTHRRIYETIGLRYDDLAKVEAVVADVKAMLETHPDIDQSQTLMVNFNAFGASSLDFFIYTFTRTTEWKRYHEVKQDVLLKIADIIDRYGAEVAFPTRTLHMPDGLKLQEEPAFAGLQGKETQ
ncbi:MAG: mechanosensitive ion channel family protein [Gammaproteobacteria bacterium]|jgi:MscS family membrane protein